MDRNATLRSQDSGVLSGASSSASNFIIRDPKLRSKLEKCLLDRNRLQIGDLIKEGNFGAVYRGTLNNHGRREMVAVKTLKVLDDNVSFEEFMKEGVLTKGKIIFIFRKLFRFFRFRTCECSKIDWRLYESKRTPISSFAILRTWRSPNISPKSEKYCRRC